MEKELLKHLEFLTAIRPFRHWGNLDSLAKAANYIENEFKSYGLSITHQKWNYGKFEYTNIIASYNPQLKKRLIIGAHYDVYLNQPGADDNTSGVAGLLLLAKQIAEKKPDLLYGIDFVSFCLEEPPHFGTKNMGSYIHAESLYANKTPVIGMICLDMIGYFSDAPNSQQYPDKNLVNILPSVGNYIAVIGLKKHAAFSKQITKGMKEKGGIDVQLINFPTTDGLAGLSDHRNYWHFGYDAVMINDTAKLRNPNYHKITDTIDTLNLEKMNAVVQCLFNVISKPITPNTQPTEMRNPEEPAAPKKDRLGFINRLLLWFRNWKWFK